MFAVVVQIYFIAILTGGNAGAVAAMVRCGFFFVADRADAGMLCVADPAPFALRVLGTQFAVAHAAALADGQFRAGGCAAVVVAFLERRAVAAFADMGVVSEPDPIAPVMGIRVWCAAVPVQRATYATHGGKGTRRCAFGRRTGEHRIPYKCTAAVAGG